MLLSDVGILELINMGTGCQLWELSTEGVEWSPVIVMTSNPIDCNSGINASNFSREKTFLSKSPSSPAESVSL